MITVTECKQGEGMMLTALAMQLAEHNKGKKCVSNYDLTPYIEEVRDENIPTNPTR